MLYIISIVEIFTLIGGFLLPNDVDALQKTSKPCNAMLVGKIHLSTLTLRREFDNNDMFHKYGISWGKYEISFINTVISTSRQHDAQNTGPVKRRKISFNNRINRSRQRLT